MHTTQRLESSTLERIRNQGKMGESFDVVLCKLLDGIEEKSDEEND